MSMTRRGALAGGSLTLLFSLTARAQPVPPGTPPGMPGDLARNRELDSWIRISADGKVTLKTGKVELGQGVLTAFGQICADELDVDLGRLGIVSGDTRVCPREGPTAGSFSMPEGGTAVRMASAEVRRILLDLAAARLGAPAERLTVSDGVVADPSSGRTVAYGALVDDQTFRRPATGEARPKPAAQHRYVGHASPRRDLPAKLTGEAIFVQDLKAPNLVHGRVVRQPSYGARLQSVDTAVVQRMPGVIKVVRDGDFLGVVARHEWSAIKARDALAGSAVWQESAELPPDPWAWLQAQPAQVRQIRSQARADGAQPARTLEASYRRPYQMHGSIGPSCAVALFQGDGLTVWSHTQGVYPDRDAIAEMLRMPKDKVRLIHTEGSGCYGHNGADDAAADAALLARALPGRPVRLQWTREQEHAWEAYGPAMVVKVSAAMDDAGQKIVDWDYALWSNTHSMRPGGAGSLIAAQSLANPFAVPPPRPIPMPEGGGDRNSIPLYKFPAARVINHFLPDMPVRVSALRALGGYMNVFVIESFMDELALAAGADPVAFRLKHLDDPRAKDVISTAAQRFGWAEKKRSAAPGRGYGFAFARYKNLAAYCAIACEVEVDHGSGRPRMVRAAAAVDSGQVVNPDGIKNQIEGAILQSMSWTLFESVTNDGRRITSIDWASYPILRFSAVPDSVEVHVIDRPGLPFLGSGEAGQGPAAAAVANAIADATGHRFRDLPLTRERIKAAIGV